MSVNPGSPILFSDMESLAALAASKLSGFTSNDYAFPPFAGTDILSIPNKITPSATYGSGSFIDGSKVLLWVFSYKTIAGNKTYAYNPVTSDFRGVSGAGVFSLTWTWVSKTGTTAPDGYIAACPASGVFLWKDIGNVETLTESGSFAGWTTDDSFNDHGANNTPCANAIWLKVMNRIHSDFWNNTTLFGGTSITFDDSFILSGPWCISVAPKCYLQLNRISVYKNLQFWYSEVDSLTGNQAAEESETFDQFIEAFGGSPNNFSWDRNVKVNGIIRLLAPFGEVFADWTIAASDPGIIISFDPAYHPNNISLPSEVSAFVFTFTDIQFTVGTPIVLTANPPSGHNLFGGSNGGLLNIVFTSDTSTFTAIDAVAIFYNPSPAGTENAKSMDLTSVLADTVLTAPGAAVYNYETHWRVFCNGVFVANTIPTIGVMPYLDQDLPQYSPDIEFPASSRRVPLNDSLTYIPSVNNRGALWPVFRDTDFTPDSLSGQPFNGSKAWQTAIFTKYVRPSQVKAVVAPSGVAEELTTIYNLFLGAGTADFRFLVPNAGMTLYVRKNDFPTVSDFDAVAASGSWFSLATAIPGFETDTTWFFALLNPFSSSIAVTASAVLISDLTAPNGTFFPTDKDSLGVVIPNSEGFSYKFSNPSHTANYPIPPFGYCVDSITVRRMAVANGNGVFLAPSTGTSALSVKLGVMTGFGWATAGAFTELQTVTIPAGQAEVTVNVFWPVLSGTPLAYQCVEEVRVRPSCNFQPQLHSTFTDTQILFNGGMHTVGYWSGAAWFDQNKAMYFQQPEVVVLPIGATIVNDLTEILNLLP